MRWQGGWSWAYFMIATGAQGDFAPRPYIRPLPWLGGPTSACWKTSCWTRMRLEIPVTTSRRSQMAVRGKIRGGKVLLDDPKALPEGTEVEVRPVKKRRPPAKTAKKPKAKKPPRTLAEQLAPFIGVVKGLPPD